MKRALVAFLVSLGWVGWAVGGVAQPDASTDGGVESAADTRLERRQVTEEPEAGPEAAGVGSVSDAFVTLAAFDFHVLFGDVADTLTSRSCRDTSQFGICQLVAGLPVPHGATIVGAEIDACDEDPASGTIEVVILRNPGNEGGDQELIADFAAGAGCRYTTAASSTQHVVDQYLDNYLVFVMFTGGDFDERFQAVRVYYRPGEGEVVPTGTEPSFFP